MLHLSRVQLQDVRCFDNLDIILGKPGEPAGWTLIVGDNATGKSTLLRSIAMGLCDEASAAGLLKESDEGYIRRGANKARITIWLHDTRSPWKKFRITTEVIRRKKGRGIFADRVKQTTDPTGGAFPWDDLFVSGYGAGRGVTGTGDISSYSAIDAVYNMFNYTEGLQNPELVIRRLMARDSSNPIEERQVFRMLCTATRAENIRLTSKGIRVDGPWGQGMPLRDLADGYKSSVLWITDLIGWALTFSPRRKSTEGIRGIVIVDELEQHLHARWQRTIVDDLRKLFPRVQFVATTHSPLIASCVGPRVDGENTDRLYVLEGTEENRVQASSHEFMRGWRMDQVLASRAFKYQISSDPEIERALREASKLATKENRTPIEEQAYQTMKNVLRDSFFSSTSPIEREAELEFRKKLHDEIKRLEEELFPDEQ
jgi:AAA domain, putative AbiEii toxin, Type IV TA system/AAA domain